MFLSSNETRLLFGCPQNITKNKMKYFWLRQSYKVGKECQEKEPKATLDLKKRDED